RPSTANASPEVLLLKCLLDGEAYALWRGFKVKRQLALDVDRWHPAFRVRRLSTFDERQELIGARLEVTVQVLFVLHVRRSFLCCLTPKLSRAAAGREAHGKLFLPCGLRPDAVSA